MRILILKNHDTGDTLETEVTKYDLFEAIHDVMGITPETLGAITKAELQDIVEDSYDNIETQLFNNLNPLTKGGNA